MPSKPKFRCHVSTCDNPATRGGYCAAHAPTHKPSTSDHRQRDPEKYRIYHSARWKALRRLILGRQPVCQLCDEQPSYSVDHVVAVEDGGSKWATANLQGLCKRCHNLKSADERRTRKATPGPTAGTEQPKPRRRFLMGIPLDPE